MQNCAYTTEASKPIEPTALTTCTSVALNERLWTDELTFPMCIPRHLKFYAALLTTSDSAYSIADMHVPHIWGMPRLDKVSSRFLVNSCIGHVICKYSYEPTNVYIGNLRMPVTN